MTKTSLLPLIQTHFPESAKHITVCPSEHWIVNPPKHLVSELKLKRVGHTSQWDMPVTVDPVRLGGALTELFNSDEDVCFVFPSTWIWGRTATRFDGSTRGVAGTYLIPEEGERDELYVALSSLYARINPMSRITPAVKVDILQGEPAIPTENWPDILSDYPELRDVSLSPSWLQPGMLIGAVRLDRPLTLKERSNYAKARLRPLDTTSSRWVSTCMCCGAQGTVVDPRTLALEAQNLVFERYRNTDRKNTIGHDPLIPMPCDACAGLYRARRFDVTDINFDNLINYNPTDVTVEARQYYEWVRMMCTVNHCRHEWYEADATVDARLDTFKLFAKAMKLPPKSDMRLLRKEGSAFSKENCEWGYDVSALM